MFRHRTTRVFACVFLATVALPPVAFAQERKINSLIPVPDLVNTSTPTPVAFIANVEPNPNLIRDSITLTEINASGQAIRVLGRMYDNGTNGDQVPNDYNYTFRVTIAQALPVTLRYRATAAYRGTILRINSPVADVSVAEPSFAKPPDPALVITDADGTYPVNQLVVLILPGTPASSVQALAASVGAIVGYSSSVNAYEFELSTTTVGALNAAIATLKMSPIVVEVIKNLIPSVDAPVDNDLTRLKAAASSNTAAYDRIKAIEGFQSLVDLNTTFSAVNVGVLDTGLLGTHEEFTGVSLAGTLTDPDGHGTSVAGIIGANNRQAFGSYPAGHMNGLLAGVTSNANPSGSRIVYTIGSRQFGSLMQILAGIDGLAASGARVINMSFGMTKSGAVVSPACETALGFNSAGSLSYNLFSFVLRLSFKARKTILFVAAAGNYGVDASNTSPANIDEPNVITIAATSLSDGRAIWNPMADGIAGCASASNFGPGVDLAAPGEQIYAPSINPLDKWRMFSGTSGAAPLVSGTAGMLLAINTGLTPENLADILRTTADTISDSSISGLRLNFKAAVLFVAQPVDLFILTDMTGSFADDLSTFKAQASSMVQTIADQKLNVYTGLGRFEDYPVNPFGDLAAGDRAYARVQNLLPVASDGNGNSTLDIVESINALSTRSGNDFPESQLAALYQMTTGAGQTVTGAPQANIPAGQQADWRDNSLRIAILWTDAAFHVAGEPGPIISYPGPSFADTITALNTKMIKVIGILAGGNLTARGHLTTVASGTSTFAPAGGVDCNGDSTTDVIESQPIVCAISSTGAGIGQAIINTVLALAKQ